MLIIIDIFGVQTTQEKKRKKKKSEINCPKKSLVSAVSVT